MRYNGLAVSLLGRVKPTDVRNYLRGTGWVRDERSRKGTAIFRRTSDPTIEIVLPVERDFIDYAARIGDAITAIARVEGRAQTEVLTDLLLPPADILRFRYDDPSAPAGLIPINTGSDLIGASKQALLSAAASAVQPQRYHSRLSKGEVEDYVSTCRMWTEAGSFVTAISCPTHKDSEPTSAQFDLFGPTPDPFGRKVTKNLLRAADLIVESIRQDSIPVLLRNPPPEISSNLCDALTIMSPTTDQGQLELSATWSRLLPIPSDVPRRVVLSSEVFPIIQAIGEYLKAGEKVVDDFFVGRIDSLWGKQNQDGQTEGDIMLVFPSQTGDLQRARVALGHADYTVACNAHRDGHFVSVRGRLIRSVRVHRIESPSEFTDLTAKSSAGGQGRKEAP